MYDQSAVESLGKFLVMSVQLNSLSVDNFYTFPSEVQEGSCLFGVSGFSLLNSKQLSFKFSTDESTALSLLSKRSYDWFNYNLLLVKPRSLIRCPLLLRPLLRPLLR